MRDRRIGKIRRASKGKSVKGSTLQSLAQSMIRRLSRIFVGAVITCTAIIVYLMTLVQQGAQLPPVFRTLLYLMISWVLAVTAYAFHTFWEIYKEEQQLKESEETYKTILGGILDSLGLGVSVISQDMEVLSMNKVMEKRHPDVNVLKRPNCYEVFIRPPRDSVCSDCPVRETLLDGQVHVAIREIGHEAKQKSMRIVASPIRDDAGNLVAVAEVVEDITDSRRAEEALRESEERFRSLYDAMSEGVCLHEIIYDDFGDAVDYRILDVNPACEAITQLKRQNVVGKKASEVYGTGEPPHLETYARVAKTGEPAAFESYSEPMDKHFSISVFSPGEGRFATVFTDISARRQAEDALIDTGRKYQSLVEQSIQGIALVQGVPPRFILVNPALAAMMGYSAEELAGLTGQQVEELIHPDDREMFFGRYRDRIEGNPSPPRYEFRAVRKDGAVRWFQILAARTQYKDEVAVQAAFLDITDLKQADQKLANERNLLRTLMDNLPDYIFVKDRQSRFITTNLAHVATLGANGLDNVIGKTDFDFFPREAAEKYYEDEQRVMDSGDPLLNRTEPVKDEQGRVNQWLLTSKVPLRDNEGNVIGLVGISRDITAQKKAEQGRGS